MEKLLLKVYKSKRTRTILKYASLISVLCGVIGFSLCLYFAYMRLPIEALKLAALSLASFLTVTVFRHLFNAPRPYELYEFYENKPRKKYGKSFPSRHVFSAFIIATIAFNYSLPLGIALSIMSFFLAVSRVLLGIHFVRDVCAGALIGAISGVIEILILNYH